ncbi:MAG: aminotransferase class I/II-fold pyridoxal phosphate-dependent enzyme [Deltaproteobacteria bacterium]|nr:aminotransferase class I/II-fold pyridoxal phosphate-dependent enzyme [Deltaproteobacteria bacterium]
MNPLAQELNKIIQETNPYIYEMLSDVGKNLFFPKGILTQSAEAKEKGYRFNATIGMATEKGDIMHLPSVMSMIRGLTPRESLSYAPSFGIPSLRETWRDALFQKNPSLRGKPISLPVVTNAITHGLSVIADMWVNPGDVIILPDKMWGNYNLIFSVRRGADIVHFNLFNDQGGFDLESFEKCLMDQAGKREKIILILNFPNNPTGYTVTIQEGNRIAEILQSLAAQGKQIVAITDDAYFGLFYDEDILKESLFARLVDLDPRLLAIKLDGATKEDYVWGLRVGFITYGGRFNGNASDLFNALERKTAGAVRGSISNASHLGQSIILKALNSESYQQEIREKYDIMKGRAQAVKEVLTDSKYASAFQPYPFNSGYFMCIRLKKVDAETLRVHLLEKYGVGLISLGSHDLRVAFSCVEKEDIPELFDTILQGVQDLGG